MVLLPGGSGEGLDCGGNCDMVAVMDVVMDDVCRDNFWMLTDRSSLWPCGGSVRK